VPHLLHVFIPKHPKSIDRCWHSGATTTTAAIYAQSNILVLR
jgi:hypothetical protein